ncbi:RimK family alpha-L-glutamate ligase [Picrophilus oshimae]|nr:RimK family alpha-L-glutamate ligase [Picrophilus oshimae]
MAISMIYDIIRWEEKSIIKALKERYIDINLINVNDLDLDINAENGSGTIIQRTTSYYKNLHSTAYYESKGYNVINNFISTIITGNKMFTSLWIKSKGVRIPETFVTFDRESFLRSFNNDLDGRGVLKPVVGSWGRMNALLNDYYAAMDIVEYKEYMYPIYQINYLQRYINDFNRDLRVFVVGSNVVAGIYRYRPENDWRTNTALGGRAEPLKITDEIEDECLRAIEPIGNGIYGIDFLESKDGLFLNEINGNTEFKNTVPVTGIDIPGLIADYIIKEDKK